MRDPQWTEVVRREEAEVTCDHRVLLRQWHRRDLHEQILQGRGRSPVVTRR